MEATTIGYLAYGLTTYALAYLFYTLAKAAGSRGVRSEVPYDATHLILKKRYM